MSPSQAEDIKDFEIDGMSVNVSLLEYFDKSYIKKIKYIINRQKATRSMLNLS